jgi:hypothetical protein
MDLNDERADALCDSMLRRFGRAVEDLVLRDLLEY